MADTVPTMPDPTWQDRFAYALGRGAQTHSLAGLLGGLLDNSGPALENERARAAYIQNQLGGLTLQGYQQLQSETGGPPTLGGGLLATSATPPGLLGQPQAAPAPPPQMALPSLSGGPPIMTPFLAPNGQTAPGPRPSGPPGPLAQPPQPAIPSAAPALPGATAPDGGGGGNMPTLPVSGSPNQGAAPPLFNVPNLYRQYQIAVRTPGMTAVAGQLLQELNKGVPEGAYLGADGSIVGRPGYNDYVAGKSYATGFGTSQGQLPADLTKIHTQTNEDIRKAGPIAGATAAAQQPYELGKIDFTQRKIGERETQQKRLEYKLATGEDAPGATPTGGPVITPQQVMAPPGQPVTTGKGTVIPPSVGNQTMGQGSKEIDLQLQNSNDTQKNWNGVRQTLEQARSRLSALTDSFSALETKGLNEGKATIANNLRGFGLNGLADSVMSAKDTGAVQSILWNDMQEVMSMLKTANAGTGGRILNSEFKAYMGHSFSPNMVGPTLHNAVTQQLGNIYQMQNMIDDYYGGAKQRGWRDANQYQSAYLTANPIEGFNDYAKKTTPAFGGMPGGPGTIDPNAAKAELRRRGIIQ